MLQPVVLAQAGMTSQAGRKAGMREMTAEAPQGAEQNPAYRPQSYFSGIDEWRVIQEVMSGE